MNATLMLNTNQELSRYFFSLIDTLSALKGLTDIPIADVTEDTLVNDAVEALIRHHDLERCSVFLLRGDRLECATVREWDVGQTTGEHPAPQSFRLGEGLVGRAAASCRLVNCPDCLYDERFPADAETVDRLQTGGSVIAAPIVIRGDVVGVVNVFHPQCEFFDALHENVITLFAGVLAQTLDNHRLYARMEEAVQQRTRKLEEALAEAQHLKLRYEQLSLVDDLTGLYNRRFFFPEAETIAARGARHGHDFSLVVIDVDNMASVGGKFGYIVADELLIRLADTIKGLVRDTDLLARVAGEEFAVGLPNTDSARARIFAQRTLHRLSGIVSTGDVDEIELKVTLGISSLADRRVDSRRSPMKDLFSMAEQALQFGRTREHLAIVSYEEIDGPEL